MFDWKKLIPPWLAWLSLIFLAIMTTASLLVVMLKYQSASASLTMLPTVAPTPVSESVMIEEDEAHVDWQVYTARDYGFSVKFPAGWETEETRAKPPDLAVKIYPSRWAGQQLPWANSANIIVDASKLARGEFEKVKAGQKPYNLDNEIKEVVFATEKCFEVTSKLPSTGGFGPETWCLKNGRVYKFQIFAYYKGQGEKELAEEILTTFKFLP